jgi:uroporphyrinogen decarboxylase
MTSRERIINALHFEKPDRVPRDLWLLAGATFFKKADVDELRRRFAMDMECAPVKTPRLPHMKGEWAEAGVHIDAWGCEFQNIQRGVVGEVKNPLVKEWSDLDKVKPPYSLVGAGMEDVASFCRASDKFILSGGVNLFERMQFIRGSENLYVDLAAGEPELYALRDMIHKFNMAYLEAWLKTPVDALSLFDDWGSQQTLLIRPRQWREFFKPCYAEYTRMIRGAGKHVFMHSDGNIMDIYEDLIEIGVSAINSQLFCMPIEEIGRRFKGRITFWGEIDRQRLLPFGTPEECRQAVRRLYRNLSHNGGGVIAQFEYGMETQLANACAVFEEWEKAG